MTVNDDVAGVEIGTAKCGAAAGVAVGAGTGNTGTGPGKVSDADVLDPVHHLISPYRRSRMLRHHYYRPSLTPQT